MLTPVSLPDLDYIPELTLIHILINLEFESPILQSRIPLMDHECVPQFFDLNRTLEPNPTLEPKLDLIHIPKSVSVLVPFILDLK